MMKVANLFAVSVLSLSVVLGACGGEPSEPTRTTESVSPEVSTSTAQSAVAEVDETSTVATTGNVIEVKMITDGAENYFEPAQISAKEGDVIRFVLDSGIHNVSFPAAKNPNGSDLPSASPYLQVAGQSYDVVVDMPAGEYTFQCDPHAVLGMIGTLSVE